MIPKIIHYCWFGGNPLNKQGRDCLESWKKFFPDYEIKEWNEDNFDVNCCQYVKEAYEAKKWAFVSDYARFEILYNEGGIYFDTDVKVIKSFDDIVEKGSFMGFERCGAVNPGLGVGACAKSSFIKEMLNDYRKSEFLKPDGGYDMTTIVSRTTRILKKYGLQETGDFQSVAGINIYPTEYFCPIDMETGRLNITENTRSIHEFAGSWEKKSSKFRGRVYRFVNRNFGEKAARFLRKILGRV